MVRKRRTTVCKRERLQKRLVYFAKKHLGKPYKYGAKPYEAPKTFDCSSFIQYLYKRINIDLPRTALQQAHLGRKIDLKKEKLETGDLIFLKREIGRYDPEFPRGIGHVAIYIGREKVIHAKIAWKKSEKDEVQEESMQNLLKRKDLIVIKRILRIETQNAKRKAQNNPEPE